MTLTFQGHSRSNLMVQLDSLYDFLLVSNSNRMSISHRLRDIPSRKFSPYLLSLGQKFAPLPDPPLPWADFSQNRITSSLCQRETLYQKGS